jgi:hypothetical protein
MRQIVAILLTMFIERIITLFQLLISNSGASYSPLETPVPFETFTAVPELKKNTE